MGFSRSLGPNWVSPSCERVDFDDDKGVFLDSASIKMNSVIFNRLDFHMEVIIKCVEERRRQSATNGVMDVLSFRLDQIPESGGREAPYGQDWSARTNGILPSLTGAPRWWRQQPENADTGGESRAQRPTVAAVPCCCWP